MRVIGVRWRIAGHWKVVGGGADVSDRNNGDWCGGNLNRVRTIDTVVLRQSNILLRCSVSSGMDEMKVAGEFTVHLGGIW